MGAYDCDCINNLEYDRRERKAQLSQEGTTKDTISRQAAIEKFAMTAPQMSVIRIYEAVEILESMPTIQPEPSIPLSWVEKYIEWLKGFDNEFANLEAAHISVMVKKWRDEQNETD